jgi:hypothetical protein
MAVANMGLIDPKEINYWGLYCPNCLMPCITRARVRRITCRNSNCEHKFTIIFQKRPTDYRVRFFFRKYSDAKDWLLAAKEKWVDDARKEAEAKTVTKEETFKICETCKTNWGFHNTVLSTNMGRCELCNQVGIVYEIRKYGDLSEYLKSSENESVKAVKLSDEEKALGVTVDEKGDKRNKEGVVMED